MEVERWVERHGRVDGTQKKRFREEEGIRRWLVSVVVVCVCVCGGGLVIDMMEQRMQGRTTSAHSRHRARRLEFLTP